MLLLEFNMAVPVVVAAWFLFNGPIVWMMGLLKYPIILIHIFFSCHDETNTKLGYFEIDSFGRLALSLCEPPLLHKHFKSTL